MSQPYQWRADQPTPGWRPPAPEARVPDGVTWADAAPAPAPVVPQAQRRHTTDEKQAAAAALGAYSELGPDYQDAVVESFLAQLDQRLAGQRAVRPAQQLMPQPAPVRQEVKKAKEPKADMGALVFCLVMAIPLSAIAGSEAGFIGILVAWVGIAFVAAVLGGFFRGRS